jgi:quinol monooxygenase YgiN
MVPGLRGPPCDAPLTATGRFGRTGKTILAGEITMFTRLLFGTIQPGKAAEAMRVLTEFADKVRKQKGCALTQVLQSGNEVVGVTTWETQQDLTAYADSEMARDLFRSITPLLMGMPTVRSYDVKVNL